MTILNYSKLVKIIESDETKHSLEINCQLCNFSILIVTLMQVSEAFTVILFLIKK